LFRLDGTGLKSSSMTSASESPSSSICQSQAALEHNLYSVGICYLHHNNILSKPKSKSYTVTSVFSSHPGDQKIVAFSDNWPFMTDCFYRECCLGSETDWPHKTDGR
jgi:hypothetical protein